MILLDSSILIELFRKNVKEKTLFKGKAPHTTAML
jgi:predicted nucleic acid-binding protein